MATRVLIINRQLVFAVTLKQALEQTGTFDVHPFTTADAAFDYLRDHPQDVALVDFALPGRSGPKVVQQLRSIQPDLAVIISPRQPDADAVMGSLRLQGMIDMPFGARDVIPLIEGALEQLQQSPLDGAGRPQADELASGQTRILGEEDPHSRQQSGTTRRLGDDAPPAEKIEEVGQTRHLDQPEEVQPEPSVPSQTRTLNTDAGKTRDLSGDSPSPTLYQTRNLDEDGPVPPPATPYPAQTRNLDTEEESAPPRPARTVYGETRDLSDEPPQSEMAEAPPAPPEISSLENVLRSFGFDPPLGEEDTPAVPMSDNEALRQFLATADGSINAEQFDDVLDAIDPAEHVEPPRRESDFDALVKSMKRGETPRGLPDRQQQLLDFVFTSGMDSVLKEIEKSKTGPLPDQPDTIPEQPREKGNKASFQKLAKEEPPMPSIEEGGTVSDLMLGVSDRGFRNVLSLLRGDEVDENEPSEKLPSTRLERHERFADFFNPVTGSQVLGEEPEDPAQVPSLPSRPAPSAEPVNEAFDFDYLLEADEEATVAQVILRTALEDLELPEGFSLNQ
ncbi:MAG: response regulator, partial [Anaerolineae bacterium]|nr:response regulator [Anaerolineae bacterium]